MQAHFCIYCLSAYALMHVILIKSVSKLVAQKELSNIKKMASFKRFRCRKDILHIRAPNTQIQFYGNISLWVCVCVCALDKEGTLYTHVYIAVVVVTINIVRNASLPIFPLQYGSVGKTYKYF